MNDRKNSIRIQECDAFVKGDDRGGMYVLEVISAGFTTNENIDFSKKVIAALNHHDRLVEALRNMIEAIDLMGSPDYNVESIRETIALRQSEAQQLLTTIEHGN